MKQNRILLCVISFLMIFNILVPVLYAQQPLSGMSEEERNKKIKQEIERVKKEREKHKHPKVSAVLIELEDAYRAGEEEAARRFQAGETFKDKEGRILSTLEEAKKKGGEEAAKKLSGPSLRLRDGNKVEVHLILSPEISAEQFDKGVLQSYGCEEIYGSGNSLYADVPIKMIRKIGDDIEGVVYIELPNYGVPLSYQTEGLGAVGASSYHSANINGSSVKIAIIDIGFAGLSSAINNGDIPSNVIKIDCTRSSCAFDSFSLETEPHGTAVAEIVHDMAPGAQLYLIKVANPENLKNAKDYCINPSNGIQVINHSVGWFNQNFYDGACLYNNAVCTAESAYSNGILWVNASGNHAKKHYQTTYTDRGFGWHTYAANDSMAVPTIWAEANKTISMHLTWAPGR